MPVRIASKTKSAQRDSGMPNALKRSAMGLERPSADRRGPPNRSGRLRSEVTVLFANRMPIARWKNPDLNRAIRRWRSSALAQFSVILMVYRDVRL